jgi:hypothetical protein
VPNPFPAERSADPRRGCWRCWAGALRALVVGAALVAGASFTVELARAAGGPLGFALWLATGVGAAVAAYRLAVAGNRRLERAGARLERRGWARHWWWR